MSSLVTSWVYWDYLQEHRWLETVVTPESPLGDIWLTTPWERRVQMKVHEDFLILITPSLPPWRKLSRLDSMKVSCRPSKLQCFKMALVMSNLEDTATLQNLQVFKELNYVFLHKYTSLEDWITSRLVYLCKICIVMSLSYPKTQKSQEAENFPVSRWGGILVWVEPQTP